jgi:hypothetical protein
MRALLLATLLLVGCRTSYRPHATITSSSGERLCAKHRTPLRQIRAYQAPSRGDRVWLVHEGSRPYYGIVGPRYPNHIPEHVALRPVWVLREPTTISYCVPCEQQFRDALRVPDERAARKFANYVLWLFSDHDTKGPYRITLEKDVWTVRCSLSDGRPASVKIGKEDGRLISYEFPR